MYQHMAPVLPRLHDIGRLSIVRFRRIHHTKTIPLQPGEQIVLKLYVSFKKFYAVVWNKK